ncbi:hypothetical protein [Pasteurella sp. PK-2025]
MAVLIRCGGCTCGGENSAGWLYRHFSDMKKATIKIAFPSPLIQRLSLL